MSKSHQYKKLINSARWRKLRLLKLSNNPLCQQCLIAGISRLANEVHHVTPVETAQTLKEMSALMFDYNNLQSLCHDCHVATHVFMRSHSKAIARERNDERVKTFKEKFLSSSSDKPIQNKQ